MTSFEMRGCIARLLRDIISGTDRFDPRVYGIIERVIIMHETYALQQQDGPSLRVVSTIARCLDLTLT